MKEVGVGSPTRPEDHMTFSETEPPVAWSRLRIKTYWNSSKTRDPESKE